MKNRCLSFLALLDILLLPSCVAKTNTNVGDAEQGLLSSIRSSFSELDEHRRRLSGYVSDENFEIKDEGMIDQHLRRRKMTRRKARVHKVRFYSLPFKNMGP